MSQCLVLCVIQPFSHFQCSSICHGRSNLGRIVCRLELLDSGATPTTLVTEGSDDEIYSVEYDYNRDILFWADQTSDTIMVR